jgi:hypothetical protein
VAGWSDGGQRRLYMDWNALYQMVLEVRERLELLRAAQAA